MSLGFHGMEEVLMRELRLYHHPIAVTWLFTDEEVRRFRETTPHTRPLKPTTFCQWEIAARMQGKTVLGEKGDLDCLGGRLSFGWRDIDEKQIKSLTAYCTDPAQTERFLRAKPRLPLDELKAVAVGPLGGARVAPHVVHFYCDVIQAYQLSVDYMAATDTETLRPLLTGTSASCGGSVFCSQEKTFNMCPACSGNFNAGKAERGEINVFIPAEHLEPLVNRLCRRIAQTGGAALFPAGDPFPGSDVCTNCPQIAFKPGHSDC